MKEFLAEAAEIEDISLQMKDMNIGPHEHEITKVDEPRRGTDKLPRYAANRNKKVRVLTVAIRRTPREGKKTLLEIQSFCSCM